MPSTAKVDVFAEMHYLGTLLISWVPQTECKIKVACRACRNHIPVWDLHSNTVTAETSRRKILPGHVPASTTLYFPCSVFPNILSVSLVNRRQVDLKIQSWGECSQCWVTWAFHSALQPGAHWQQNWDLNCGNTPNGSAKKWPCSAFVLHTGLIIRRILLFKH